MDAGVTDTLLDPGHSLRKQLSVILMLDGSRCVRRWPLCEGTAINTLGTRSHCTVHVASCQTPHVYRV